MVRAFSVHALPETPLPLGHPFFRRGRMGTGIFPALSCQAPSSCAVSRSRRLCSWISANFLARRISTRLLTSPWAEVTRQGPMRRDR